MLVNHNSGVVWSHLTRKGPKKTVAETVIRPASPAQELAIDLIDEHHEHLQKARILWLFTSSKRTRGGHVVLGSSSRSNPLQRYLSQQQAGAARAPDPADFVVLIDEGRWKRALATQRLALVDHLLCTMVQRETANKRSGEITKTWATVGPDINEFASVIERHGVWLPEQQIMARAMRSVSAGTLKLEFPDLDEDPQPAPEAPVDRGEERETTVDAEGTVQATKRVRPPKRHHEPVGREAQAPRGYEEIFGDEQPRGLEDLPDVLGLPHAEAQDAQAETGPDGQATAEEPLPERSPQANGHADAPVPTGEAADVPWQITAGIGSSDAEQRRRNRVAAGVGVGE